MHTFSYMRNARMGIDENERPSRQTVRRVLTFARPYRRQLIAFVSVIVLEAVLALIPTLIFRELIDTTIPNEDTRQLALLAGVVIFVGFANAALSLLERWWSARIGEGLIYDLRTALHDHVQRMPVGFFTRTRTGALTNRMNNDVIGAQRALTGTLGSVASNGAALTATLITVFALEWRLTLLSLVLLPMFLIPASRVGKRLAGITLEGMNLNAEMNTGLTERLSASGAQLVKLYGRYDDEQATLDGQAARVRDIGVRQAMTVRTFMTGLELVGTVALGVLYWLGGLLVVDGGLTLGTLAALTILVPRIYQPLSALSNTRVDVMGALVSFDRVFEVLDLPNPITDRPDAVELVAPAGGLEFDHVDFSYPGSEATSIASLEAVGEDHREGGPVLRDVSAVVEPGWTVALVGPSGAGKTTMASLVPRLWDVSGGSISVDGHDVRSLTQDSLRAAIGVVPQDPHLFHVTVAENLRYARPDATDDELREAARAAQVLHVIEALPQGFDTVVGERGYRLSGGEKQRVAIARMLLKDPSIVILDEATSSLDTESEAAVQRALSAALRGRTALVIAHRLSTIVGADLILVLDEGRVVERGRHGDLLAEDGLYAALYRTLVEGSERLLPEVEPVAP
ncbi:MAG: ABC transporter ATP-binding protein [Microthrixaceae bacterium]